MMGNNYICACCEGEFTPPDDWTEGDALAQKQMNFKNFSMDEMEVICDDCFHQVMAANNSAPIKRFG
jgi:DNA-directed RNA polymerase subunit RPC12/RpoP